VCINFFNVCVNALITHHYIADIVGGLHQEGDWNDDWWTRGCVAGLWQ